MNTIKTWLGLHNTRLSVRDWTLLAAPLFLFFSYYPVISLGRGQYGTNYELSLAELYLVVYTVINLPMLWRQRQEILSQKSSWLPLIFGLYNTVSLAWTPDLARGLLTAGIIWMLILLFFSFLVDKKLPVFAGALARVFVASALVMCLFAWYQLFAGSSPQLSSSTLLCPGCQANQFGFARPNAFTIEPQFLGNLLLAPTLLLTHAILTKRRRGIVYLAFGILFCTIVMTLSRGALLGLIAGITILFIVDRPYYKRFIIPINIGCIGIIAALTSQGLAAQFNPSVSVTFSQAIAVSINQLSLGKIDLRTTASSPSIPSMSSTKSEQPVFQGYVEHSTDDRVTESCRALDIWASSPSKIIFGTGLAGTGYYFEQQLVRSDLPWCKTNT